MEAEAGAGTVLPGWLTWGGWAGRAGGALWWAGAAGGGSSDIADSDEETTEPIELGTTREAGNALFKQKKYAAAIATYSALLDDADDRLFALDGQVDLRAEMNPAEPLFRLSRIGE